MSEIDRYIGARLREAREGAALSPAELAERLGHDAAWLSAAEEGAAPLAARDLWLLSMVLHTSVSHFFPGVRDADLDDAERAFLALFRQLDPAWQTSVTESLRSQLALMRESSAIEALPEAQRRQARYRALARYLLVSGARVELGPRGRPRFTGAEISAVLEGMPEAERVQVAEAAYRLAREQREEEERERAEAARAAQAEDLRDDEDSDAY